MKKINKLYLEKQIFLSKITIKFYLTIKTIIRINI